MTEHIAVYIFGMVMSLTGLVIGFFLGIRFANHAWSREIEKIDFHVKKT